MSDINVNYGTSSNLNITLTGLSTNNALTLLTGQQSDVVLNSGGNYFDILLGGKITVGTSPTTSRQIEVWLYGNLDDTPNFPDTFSTGDSARTISSEGTKNSALKLFQVISTDATSNQTYWFGPGGIASSFGGYIPKYWGVYVQHNTAVNLNTTGSNHSISYTPIYEQIN